MTITSVGFKGTVNELDWSTLAKLLGHDRCLAGPGDLQVTAGPTKGQFSIGTGGAFGAGVLSTSDAAETVPSAPLSPANGQWFLLVQNRDWGARVATYAVRNGPQTAAGAPGGMTLPASFPASFQDSPGQNLDVPVAWVWVGSAAASPIIVPLLLPPKSVVPRSGDYTARDSMVARMVSTAQGRAYLQSLGEEWYEPSRGWVSRYFAEYDASANPGGASPAGWFPVAGKLPLVNDWRSNDTIWNTSAGGSQLVTWNGTAPVVQNGTWDRRTFTSQAAGRYRFSGALGMPPGSGFVQALLYRNGSIIRRIQGQQNGKTSNLPFSFEATLAFGDTAAVGTRAETSRLTMQAKDVQGGVMTWLDIEYLGPVQSTD